MKSIIFGKRKKLFGKCGSKIIVRPIKKYWKNKKVLITGHTGFMGSWLCLVLKLYGCKIYGISNKENTKPSLFKIMKVDKLIFKHFVIDINDLKKLKNIFKEIEPDIIFHLAAQPLVKYSINNPIETFKTNVIGTINVCEASRNLKRLSKVILITTDKCYKNSNSKKIKFFNESSELGGEDPYSASKACAEIAIHAYQNIFFKNKKVKISSARAGNIIGGGDWAKDRLVPDIFRSLYYRKDLKIRYPNATRPWQHVLDVINGYLLLAQSNYYGAWNFGPNLKKTFKVKDILLDIKRKNPKLRWKIVKPKKIQESINLNLDIKKAKNILKWQPKWKIKKAVEETYRWYENFYNKKDINYLTMKQIKDFFKL